ncbi:sugar phosphate permease [Murinocardiopsis flavida]|uniref:Sugar phosphate permease n=1 Tax=Murinocardiopsis flavida TaxID=645275 RepID=A0A2P8D141_9ACTN|nr:MFS transporter [Murinocardiopsis flavida]PSK90935.1 sugar phosphate permease [Murinocardiopsis flavida]
MTAQSAVGGRRTRTRFAVLASDFVILALNYADRAVIGVAAPLIIAEFGFSKAAFGWILAAFAFTYSPFGFIGGWLADKFGPRNVMGWAAIAWSAFTALTAAGTGFVSLLIIRLLFGAGEGPQATVTAKIMQNWFPKRELGMAVGIANAATPLGGAIGTPVVVAIMGATQGNWRLPFIIFGALGILCAIGWFVVVRDTPEQHPRVSPAELSHIRQDTEAPSTEKDPAANKGWWRFLGLRAVWSTAIAFFGYAWILWTFLNWFPTYLVEERGIDLDGLAVSASIPWIGGCIGLALGGIFTDWLVRRTGLTAGPRRWTVVLCLAATGALFGAVPMVSSEPGAVALMTVVVFLLYFTGAQYWIIVGEAVPSSVYGSVSGAVQMFATTASIIAPMATGYLVDSSLGWGGMFSVAAGIALLGSLLLAVFGQTYTRKPAPDPAS